MIGSVGYTHLRTGTSTTYTLVGRYMHVNQARYACRYSTYRYQKHVLQLTRVIQLAVRLVASEKGFRGGDHSAWQK